MFNKRKITFKKVMKWISYTEYQTIRDAEILNSLEMALKELNIENIDVKVDLENLYKCKIVMKLNKKDFRAFCNIFINSLSGYITEIKF